MPVNTIRSAVSETARAGRRSAERKASAAAHPRAGGQRARGPAPHTGCASPGGSGSRRASRARSRSTVRAPRSCRAAARHGGTPPGAARRLRVGRRQQAVDVRGQASAVRRQSVIVIGHRYDVRSLQSMRHAVFCGTALSRLEQQAAPARDARHHRSDRDAEHLRNLRIGELLHVAQPDRLAERLGQRVERRLQVGVERGPEQDPLGRVVRASGRPAAAASSTRALSISTGSRAASRRRFRHVLWRIVYSQALRFVPGVNRSENRSALTNVSWTRSSASARFRVSRSAVAYSGSRNASASAASASRSSAVSRRNIGTRAITSNPAGGGLFPERPIGCNRPAVYGPEDTARVNGRTTSRHFTS